MNCSKCQTAGEFKEFTTFAYWWCPVCRIEIDSAAASSPPAATCHTCGEAMTLSHLWSCTKLSAASITPTAAMPTGFYKHTQNGVTWMDTVCSECGVDTDQAPHSAGCHQDTQLSFDIFFSTGGSDGTR